MFSVFSACVLLNTKCNAVSYLWQSMSRQHLLARGKLQSAVFGPSLTVPEPILLEWALMLSHFTNYINSGSLFLTLEIFFSSCTTIVAGLGWTARDHRTFCDARLCSGARLLSTSSTTILFVFLNNSLLVCTTSKSLLGVAMTIRGRCVLSSNLICCCSVSTPLTWVEKYGLTLSLSSSKSTFNLHKEKCISGWPLSRHVIKGLNCLTGPLGSCFSSVATLIVGTRAWKLSLRYISFPPIPPLVAERFISLGRGLCFAYHLINLSLTPNSEASGVPLFQLFG